MLKKLSPPNNEKEITASWIHKDKVYVSIICTTFNHERYIKDALDGFLAQKTTFRYEIVIHDDASTDNTQEIIKSYQEKYPGLIKCILQTENQYSKGVEVVGLAVEQSLGEYVALCEGDDYWVSDKKIETQLSKLLRFPEVQMSFHTALQIDCRDNKEEIIGIYGDHEKVIRVDDIIHKTNGILPTASTMVSKKAFSFFTETVKDMPYLLNGDIYLQILSSMPEGALFIPEPMSVYRFFAEGSWNSKRALDTDKMYVHLKSGLRAYTHFQTMFKSKFDVFESAKIKRVRDFLTNEEYDLSVRLKCFDDFNDLFSKKEYAYHWFILNNNGLFKFIKPYIKTVLLPLKKILIN